MATIPLYRLSAQGRRISWREWQRMGGCGLSEIDRCMVARVYGPQSHWSEDLTLGEIEDAWLPAGRGLARFAVEHLGRPEWAEMEYERR